MAESLDPHSGDDRRWDLVALGEVMLRLDPGEGRISTARAFRAWEGGGEYNVARGLRRAFGLRTTLVTAFADNPIGRLLEDLVLQGGVDMSHVRWVPVDGASRTVRNALNFTERGFGIRRAVGCSDRGHTAASQLRPGEIDWDKIFGREGARWLHTGGIFAGLSATIVEVAEEAMKAARAADTVVSYDLNYRPSLWEGIGGVERAREVNQRLAGFADVLFGNEEDLHMALGYAAEGTDLSYTTLDAVKHESLLRRVVRDYPALKLIATSMREVRSASSNRWGGMCVADDSVYTVQIDRDLEILDRMGGGDSFASGIIYGLLTGLDEQQALELGVAHGALAMSTPGDTSMATLADVRRIAAGGNARVQR